eukprot:gb/GFBE01028254.1/.p1 GENE.gb/GFBE01028254.1/~~gb/GFBE01028254.1/.p1  ORF type:complete len:105 (+),score=13.42 gb/GFBE01028254.1/:1-315(+)
MDCVRHPVTFCVAALSQLEATGVENLCRANAWARDPERLLSERHVLSSFAMDFGTAPVMEFEGNPSSFHDSAAMRRWRSHVEEVAATVVTVAERSAWHACLGSE